MSSDSRLLRTEAIILRRRPFGEADWLLSMMTLRRGKMTAIGKGARKPTSRKSGHLEPFTRADLLIAWGRDLPLVTQAETLEPYIELRADLTKVAYAGYMAELMDRFMGEGEESERAFYLLAGALRMLDEGDDPRLIARHYELRLLGLAGYQPQLFSCVLGGDEIRPQDQYFSFAYGGVVCPQDAEGTGGRFRPVSLAALKVMRYIQTHDYEHIRTLRLPSGVHAEVENLLQGYISFILERRLQSVAFIKRLRRGAGG